MVSFGTDCHPLLACFIGSDSSSGKIRIHKCSILLLSMGAFFLQIQREHLFLSLLFLNMFSLSSCISRFILVLETSDSANLLPGHPSDRVSLAVDVVFFVQLFEEP